MEKGTSHAKKNRWGRGRKRFEGSGSRQVKCPTFGNPSRKLKTKPFRGRIIPKRLFFEGEKKS